MGIFGRRSGLIFERVGIEMDPGTTGAIIGSTIGVIGGIVGTCVSIRKARSQEEKRWVMKVSLVTLMVVVAFVCGLLLLPRPYNHFLWLPYVGGLFLGLKWMSRR